MSYRDDFVMLAERSKARDRRARLPVLDDVRVASPCTMAWELMVGDDRVRHCAACDRNVYNLSALTRDAAEALIARRHGRLCVRYFQRTDGTILTADCPVGRRQRTRRRLIAAGATAVLAGAAVAIVAAHPTHAQDAPSHPVDLMRAFGPASPDVSHDSYLPYRPVAFPNVIVGAMKLQY
jgi:hypothetical protein